MNPRPRWRDLLSWWRRDPVEYWDRRGQVCTVQLDGMEIAFPSWATPAQVDQWMIEYRERVPPW